MLVYMQGLKCSIPYQTDLKKKEKIKKKEAAA